jgi:DUF971 family protein
LPVRRCAWDEWTRKRRIQRAQIKSDIKPLHVEAVGRYAVQIDWNDGHKKGIYPYSLLYAIATARAQIQTRFKIAGAVHNFSRL